MKLNSLAICCFVLPELWKDQIQGSTDISRIIINRYQKDIPESVFKLQMRICFVELIIFSAPSLFVFVSDVGEKGGDVTTSAQIKVPAALICNCSLESCGFPACMLIFSSAKGSVHAC